MLRAGAAKASALFFIIKVHCSNCGWKSACKGGLLIGSGFNVGNSVMHGHNFAAKAEPNPRILRLGRVKGEQNFINRLRDDTHTVVAKLENRALMLVEGS